MNMAGQPFFSTSRRRTRLAQAVLVSFLALAWSCWAQLPVPASTQFDITGFIQSATLGGAGTGSGAGAHMGGVITVNGHVVIVPSETIVILPANALTWQELFAQAPAPYTGVATGMALADVPAPMTTYEAHIIGNRVGDTYIAGLVYISQHALNTGAGFINFIDYSTGEMRVGGAIGSSTTGTRVRLNDPLGRYGRIMSPDPRFTVDADNPTIASATGFPMCIPRVTQDPTVPGNPDDPLCPQSNRPISTPGNPPVFAPTIQTNDPVALPGVPPDATKQAPFEVGDYVIFAGTLVQDGATPTAGPWPAAGTAATYISAHTISNNIAIYTWPGSNPAYVKTDVTIIGTGGLSVAGANEAAVRTRFEGMSTDPSRNIHLYGIDVNPPDGATSDRDWGTIAVDPGPPSGAVKGRWRYRPPCIAALATVTDCTPPPAGTYLPPTREVRAVIEGAWVPGQTTAYANGIIAGQYHAPILEYIFPENVPGTPIVANNFNTIDFLARGGYTSSAGTLAGILNPWPNDVAPPAGCTAPTPSAGGPYTVASGGTITLNASATGTSPFTFLWSTPAQGTLSDPTIANPVYSAPIVATQTTAALQVGVTNCGGFASAGTTVTINAAAAPTVNPVAPVSVFSGAASNFPISGSDPAGLALTFNVTQSGTPALLNLTVLSSSANTAVVFFTAPTLPLGQVTPSVVSLTITATNSGGATSAPEFTTVTVNPLPDAITITSAEYRTLKQRLIINATSSVVSPNVVLKLQPYVTTSGTTYNPDPAAGGLGNTFTNNLNGTYTIDLAGVPEPAVPPATPLDVKSNLNGDSGPFGLTRIRQ
ncbi:MAG TPA: hypothetical protein VLT16_09035 [Candidatus Limnocylindrales bacterium]|nr:hypothetical protein [Candidatus Limnocylindrales bacterium]